MVIRDTTLFPLTHVVLTSPTIAIMLTLFEPTAFAPLRFVIYSVFGRLFPDLRSFLRCLFLHYDGRRFYVPVIHVPHYCATHFPGIYRLSLFTGSVH